MKPDAIAAILDSATEKARRLSRKTLRVLNSHPRVRERLKRDLAARGINAEDIASILGGVLPDSALPGLIGHTPPQN